MTKECQGVRVATQFSIKDGKRWKTRFFTIWGGQALSILGSQLVQFALIWHLTVKTGSATVLATASLVGMLPHVILGPLVDTLVDRWNRRLIMLFADSIIALATIVLALLFALDAAAPWHIYVVMFIRSMASGLHGNAMSASTSLMDVTGLFIPAVMKIEENRSALAWLDCNQLPEHVHMGSGVRVMRPVELWFLHSPRM